MITVGFDRTVRLWDLTHKRLEKTVQKLLAEPAVAMALSADGKRPTVHTAWEFGNPTLHWEQHFSITVLLAE
jgi:hypothetical protein